jgi:hypothetical protein
VDTAGDEWHPSPIGTTIPSWVFPGAKTYYVTKIHNQTTYLTSGVGISLMNITNADPIWYRCQESGGTWTAWTHYAGELLSQNLFAQSNTKYILACVYQAGDPTTAVTGIVKTRFFCYTPASPTVAEPHPSIVWKNDTEKNVIKTRLAREPYKTAYDRYYGSVQANASSATAPDGKRYGYRDYWPKIDNALLCGFVCQMEGYAYSSYAIANKGKAFLLDVFTVDPIGEESQFSNLGETVVPCAERCLIGYDRINYWELGAAYDMLADYTVGNGYAQGFTPLQELKARDNIASEIKGRLQFRYLENSNKGVGNEIAMHGMALGMPQYDTPYFGKAAGTAINTYCPFPGQAVSWLTAIVDSAVSTPGYPNLDQKCQYYTWLSPYAGMWREVYGFGYMQNIEKFGYNLNLQYNYDGTRFPHMENHWLDNALGRHPGTGNSVSQEEGVAHRCVYLTNSRFPNAGTYKWHISTPARSAETFASVGADVPFLLFYDDQVQPQVPTGNLMVFKNEAVFTSNFADSHAVWLRMQLMDYAVPYFPAWVPDIIIDGYGEYLAVRPGYGITDGYQYNTMLVDGNGVARAAVGSIKYRLESPDIQYAAGALGSSMYGTKQVGLVRHILFVDKKYFVVADELTSTDGIHAYGFVLHGSSDGSTAAGRFDVDDADDIVTWTKAGGVKLKAQFVGPAVTITNATMNSDATGYTEPYITATANGVNVRFLTLLTPLNVGQAAPQVSNLNSTGISACAPATGLDTVMVHTKSGNTVQTIAPNYATDAKLTVLKNHAGAFASLLMVEGKQLTYKGTTYINTAAQVNAALRTNAVGCTLNLAGSTTTAPAGITIGGLTTGHLYQLTSSLIITTVYFQDSLVTDNSQLVLADSIGQATFTQDLRLHRVVLADQGTSAVTPGEAAHYIGQQGLLHGNPLRAKTGVLFESVRNHTIKLYDLSGNPLLTQASIVGGVLVIEYNGKFEKIIVLK